MYEKKRAEKGVQTGMADTVREVEPTCNRSALAQVHPQLTNRWAIQKGTADLHHRQDVSSVWGGLLVICNWTMSYMYGDMCVCGSRASQTLWSWGRDVAMLMVPRVLPKLCQRKSTFDLRPSTLLVRHGSKLAACRLESELAIISIQSFAVDHVQTGRSRKVGLWRSSIAFARLRWSIIQCGKGTRGKKLSISFWCRYVYLCSSILNDFSRFYCYFLPNKQLFGEKKITMFIPMDTPFDFLSSLHWNSWSSMIPFIPLRYCVVILLFPTSVFVLQGIYNQYLHPLHHFPGPFWGGFTDFYKLYIFAATHIPSQTMKLHARYGLIIYRLLFCFKCWWFWETRPICSTCSKPVVVQWSSTNTWGLSQMCEQNKILHSCRHGWISLDVLDFEAQWSRSKAKDFFSLSKSLSFKAHRLIYMAADWNAPTTL